MGFVTLGFFIFEPDRRGRAAIVQMISHGFISGAMFLCIGVMYDRMHTRQIADYGGVVNTMPKFAAFFMLFAMANAGLPAHQRLRRRVHGDPGRGQVQLLDRARRRPRRWSSAPPTRCGCTSGSCSARWPTSTWPRCTDVERARVPDPAAAGRGGAVDGRLSEAVHRPDGRLGQATCSSTCSRASSRCDGSAVDRRTTRHGQLNLFAALPEIVLLVAACADPGGRPVRRRRAPQRDVRGCRWRRWSPSPPCCGCSSTTAC